jgi:hypothetical protein
VLVLQVSTGFGAASFSRDSVNESQPRWRVQALLQVADIRNALLFRKQIKVCFGFIKRRYVSIEFCDDNYFAQNHLPHKLRQECHFPPANLPVVCDAVLPGTKKPRFHRPHQQSVTYCCGSARLLKVSQICRWDVMGFVFIEHFPE